MASTDSPPIKQAARLLFATPATGSANPAVSLESLWSYLQPALDHLLTAKDGPAQKTPTALEPAYHMGIHTAIYNYFTSQSQSDTGAGRQGKQSGESPSIGTAGNQMERTSPDLYQLLDKYLQATVQDIFQTVPNGGQSLVEYYVTQFERFAAGMQSIHRLLNYINRHYVKRAQDEDRGWLRMVDVLDEKLAKSLVIDGHLTQNKVLDTLKERRLKELKEWGYDPGTGEQSLMLAESCAEAASPPDRIVHINGMGLRRWRIEMTEPLMAVPKVGTKPSKGGGGGGHKVSSGVNRPPALMSRLARAVQEVLESGPLPAPERKNLAERLDKSLGMVGVRRDHALRKRLHRCLTVPQTKKSGRPK